MQRKEEASALRAKSRSREVSRGLGPSDATGGHRPEAEVRPGGGRGCRAHADAHEPVLAIPGGGRGLMADSDHGTGTRDVVSKRGESPPVGW